MLEERAYHEEWMQHHLIMFSGASPGAGKSTLSAFLSHQFHAHHKPHRWMYEEDPIVEYTPFFQALQAQQPDTIRLFLEASARFVRACRSDNPTIIDAILPGYGFFFGRHQPSVIADFSQQVNRLLAPLHPLLIYVDAEPQVALERAIQQRGRAWFARMVQRMNTWNLPLYPTPFTDVASVAVYEQQARTLTHQLLKDWQGPTLLLDTTATVLPQLKVQLRDYFALEEDRHPEVVATDDLGAYVGHYRAISSDSISSAVEITCIGEDLFINQYWPQGTKLIAEERYQFRLENTNYRVTFAVGRDEKINGLHLLLRERISTYTK